MGVLSSTDFMHWVGNGEQGACRPSCPKPGCFHTAWQIAEGDDLPTDEVGTYMTTDPVTVPPNTPIAKLARKMIDAHIHRIIVVNEENQPIGVVSSTDILAALAYAER